ncbi:MAG: hypothetical protein R8L07_00495 [Alphaproteobacteria bacterium]|nr:hypothetical protein [Alphaproteobacteria bacterium]
MYDFLMSAALLCGGLVLAWTWLQFQGAENAQSSELGEMGTILFCVLLTGLVSIGTAYAFTAVHALDFDGPAGIAALAGVFALPVFWLVLLGRLVRSEDPRMSPEIPDTPVNDNHERATHRLSKRRKAA